jgi:hypothetical protein
VRLDQQQVLVRRAQDRVLLDNLGHMLTTGREERELLRGDAPNLGKVLPGGTNISPAVIVQDAYGEFKLHDAFVLDAGLMFVPFSRNGK